MHVGSQQALIGWLHNMHAQHPGWAKRPSIIFGYTIQHLRGNHAYAGATSSTWPRKMVSAVVLGYCDDVVKAFTLKQMHRGKGLQTGGVDLIV